MKLNRQHFAELYNCFKFYKLKSYFFKFFNKTLTIIQSIYFKINVSSPVSLLKEIEFDLI